MATKSANVLARVEPEVKEQAELIMAKLGIPASVVINMLYKQIIMTQSIPFSLTIQNTLITKDSITNNEFDSIMKNGLYEAQTDKSRLASLVFDDLRKELS